MSCENINVGNGQLVYFGGNTVDAFGRVRVSNPLTIFDSKNIMSQNNLFDASTANGGSVTYTANKSTVNLNVTEAAGSKTIRQSKRVMSYQPGKSLLIFNTFVMNAQTTNLKQKVGLFDGNNGIFFQDTGTGYQIVRRTYTSGAAVDTEINQSDWNGDKLNGTGLSGFTLNAATSNILFIDIEWLGVGSVRVGFVINGQLITAHTFNNANSLTTVYMQTANLPIRYEIERVGTLVASTYTLQQICSSCISEGGYQPEGLQQMIGTTTLSTGVNLSNNDFEWGLFVNATLTSSFSYSSFSDNVEYDLQTTAFSTAGTRIAGGYMGGKTAPFTLGGDFIAFANQLGQTIAGVSDTLTLGVRPGTANGDVAGLI
jgi:hypothetical protein